MHYRIEELERRERELMGTVEAANARAKVDAAGSTPCPLTPGSS
jgi:hypothetical protein